jgi:NAD(P)-dependent dehydrogenase (short-subunit alcohol dehydrogenase family)
MRLANKVALITGAGQGIGRETAVLFAQEGAKVVVADINLVAAQAVADEIGGGNAIAVRADVSNAADSAAMVAAAEEAFGGLHILFNNAGIMHSQDDNAITTDEAILGFDDEYQSQRGLFWV